MASTNNQRGDAASAIVIIIGLMILSIGGIYAYANHRQAMAPVASPSPTPHSAAEAQARLKTFYTQYDSTNDVASVKDMIDPAYYTQLIKPQGYDPITCSAAASNQPMRIEPYHASAATATYKVTQNYPGKGDSVMIVDVRLTDLLITRITCPSVIKS